MMVISCDRQCGIFCIIREITTSIFSLKILFIVQYKSNLQIEMAWFYE
jgi:hypothetical protein